MRSEHTFKLDWKKSCVKECHVMLYLELIYIINLTEQFKTPL